MTTADTKPIWASKTVIGAVITMAATGLTIAGYDVGDTGQLTEQITALLGTFLVIYGRVSATKKVRMKR